MGEGPTALEANELSDYAIHNHTALGKLPNISEYLSFAVEKDFASLLQGGCMAWSHVTARLCWRPIGGIDHHPIIGGTESAL